MPGAERYGGEGSFPDMGKPATVLFTTVVTATLTSLFWIGAYSLAIGGDAPAPPPADADRAPAVVPAKARPGPATS